MKLEIDCNELWGKEFVEKCEAKARLIYGPYDCHNPTVIIAIAIGLLKEMIDKQVERS